MVIREKAYTVDEYYAWMEERDDDMRFELIEGRIVEMAPPRNINSYIAGRVVFYLTLYDEENNLGYTFGADGGFALSSNDVCIPDASFVAKERIQGDISNLTPGAPDLAVEVISPSETSASINEKTRFYLETGGKVVWVIYPDERFAEIRTPSDKGFHVETVAFDDVLKAESVLPDFELPLNKVLPKIQSTQEA